MEIKVDKVFITVLIVSLLFGNLLYMWGRHNGMDCSDNYELASVPNTTIYVQEDTHNDDKITVAQEQIEVIRTQLSQLNPDWR